MKLYPLVLIVAGFGFFSSVSKADDGPFLNPEDTVLFGELTDANLDTLDAAAAEHRAQIIDEARRSQCRGGRRGFSFEYQGIFETQPCKAGKSSCYYEGKVYRQGAKWTCENRKTCNCSEKGEIVLKP